MIQLFFPLYQKENTNLDFSMIKQSPMNWPLTIQHPSWGHPKDKAGRELFLLWGWGVDFKAQSTTPCRVGKEQRPALSMP